MVVQYSTPQSEFVPTSKNPYEDMSYNDWSILIDAAISTQGKLEDVDNSANHNNNNTHSNQSSTNNVTVNTEVNVEIKSFAPMKERQEEMPTKNTSSHDTIHIHALCSGDTTTSADHGVDQAHINNNSRNDNSSSSINHNIIINNNNSNSSSNGHDNHVLCPSKKNNPVNSFIGCEISRLPLRKRHLVPESAYYNIHQCLASPQSPPTPKLFGSGNGLSGSNEALEQRVPSPNTKKEQQQQQHHHHQQEIARPHPNPTTEEDEVDVESVDEEFTNNSHGKGSIESAHRPPPLTLHSNGTPLVQPHTPTKVAENTLVKVESDQELDVDILMDDDEDISHRSNSNHTPSRSSENSVKKEHGHNSHNNHSHSHDSHKKRSKHQRSRSSSHKKIKREKEKVRDTLMQESESDSVSDDDEDDAGDNRLYCVCRKKYDSNSFMIACDKCDEWYHGECVNISEKDAKKIDRYVCMKCKKKDKHSSSSSSNNNSSSNSNSNNSNSRDSFQPTSPKVTSSQTNLTNSPLLQSSDSKHNLSTSNNTSPTHTSNSSSSLSSSSSFSSSSLSSTSSKPDLRRCSYSKCNGFASGPSKYCSKECGVANAKEIINKNPSIQRSVLSAPNSPPNSTVAPVAAASTATASTSKSSPPVSDSNPLTQKLMSTSNCDDISKLKEISQKRSEIETKLKKLEKKSSEFEKTIHMTKFRAESAELYNNISTTTNNGAAFTPKPNNSPPTNTPCVFPQKESATGICGVLNCTEHPNWEKKKRDFFTKEQSLYTKALRDIALEEKQIHQRIARRNKIANMSFPIGCETGSSSDY